MIVDCQELVCYACFIVTVQTYKSMTIHLIEI